MRDAMVRLLQLSRLIAVTIPRSISGGLRGWLERAGEGGRFAGAKAKPRFPRWGRK